MYNGHRKRSRQNAHPSDTVPTPNSIGSTAPSNSEIEALVQARVNEREAAYWRVLALDGSTRQQPPQSYHPPPQSQPSQYPRYLPPNSNFALGGGDAQHQGHTDHRGYLSVNEAYAQFRAQQEHTPMNTIPQQLVSLGGFSLAGNSGYHSTASTGHATWEGGATQQPPPPYEANA